MFNANTTTVLSKPIRVLHVLGTDVPGASADKGQWQAGGTNDTGQMLRMVGPAIQVSSMMITPAFLKQGRGWEPGKFDLVWNAISDPDQNPKCLSVFKAAFEDKGRPVVNRADKVAQTRRHIVPSKLAGKSGIVAPKTLLLRLPNAHRIKAAAIAADFSFPAILRRAGTHNGAVLGVYESVESLSGIFGDRKNTYFLTEFVDVRWADGLFRKTRCFFVGDKILTRHHVITNTWNVHGSNSRDIMPGREDLIQESRHVLIAGYEGLPDRVRASLEIVRETIGLDYCGIDFCMMENDDIVVFECNATMNFRPKFSNPITQHNKVSMPRLMSGLLGLASKSSGVNATGLTPV